MAFTESPLWSLDSFTDICNISTQLPAHPSCPFCAPTYFTFLQTGNLTLLTSSVFQIPLDIEDVWKATRVSVCV